MRCTSRFWYQPNPRACELAAPRMNWATSHSREVRYLASSESLMTHVSYTSTTMDGIAFFATLASDTRSGRGRRPIAGMSVDDEPNARHAQGLIRVEVIDGYVAERLDPRIAHLRTRHDPWPLVYEPTPRVQLPDRPCPTAWRLTVAREASVSPFPRSAVRMAWGPAVRSGVESCAGDLAERSTTDRSTPTPG